MAENARTLAMVAIVKNEADYLLEWIAFHRYVGFDQIHLADNASTDGTRALLRPLERAGVVSYTHWPLEQRAQFHWYNHAIRTLASATDYMAFLDADEFLYPRADTHVATQLQRLLEPEDVGAVAVNWQIFGSAGHRETRPGLVLERFTQGSRSTRRVNAHIKSVVKPARVARMWSHAAVLQDGFRYLDVNGAAAAFVDDDPKSGRTQTVIEGPLAVQHYAVKSEQEFREIKSRRGRANLGSGALRDMSYFTSHDINDYPVEVDAALLEGVRAEVRRLESLVRQG